MHKSRHDSSEIVRACTRSSLTNLFTMEQVSDDALYLTFNPLYKYDTRTWPPLARPPNATAKARKVDITKGHESGGRCEGREGRGGGCERGTESHRDRKLHSGTR